jgi:hypothetical protein
VLHGDGLPDVQGRDRVRDPIAKHEIRVLLFARHPLGQRAGARQQRLQKRGRVHQFDAFPAHDVCHR